MAAALLAILLAAGQPAPAQPQPAAPQPAASPAPAPQQPAASQPAAPQPAASQPAAPQPAAQQPAAQPAPKPAAPEPPPIEYTLTVREGAWRVRVTLRPGQPEPGQRLEILLDVAKHPDIPDPTYGDRIPLQKARLALALSGPGQRERHRLWPLGDAGIYGTHWTPSGRGLWTAALEPLDAKDEAPRVSFQIGAGVPMPASSEGQAVHAARVILADGAPPPAGQRTLRDVMNELGDKWLQVRGADAKGDDAAALKAIAQLSRAAQGHAPPALAQDAAEFDKLATELADTLEVLAATPKDQRHGKLADLESDSCLRCHVKFRDGVVGDLSKWPEVKPWRR